MPRTKRIVISADDSTTDVRGGGHANAMGSRGAGDAKFMLVGFAADGEGVFSGTYRGYIHFPLDSRVADAVVDGGAGGYDNIKTIVNAYVQFTTREKNQTGSPPWDRTIFATSGDAKARIHRLTTAPAYTAQGDGLYPDAADYPPMPQARWDSDDFTGLTSNNWTKAHWDDFVSPNANGITRIRCAGLVAAWSKSRAGGHDINWKDPDGGPRLKRAGNPAHWDDTFDGFPNDGIVLKTPQENTDSQSLRFEVWSTRADLAKHEPKLVVVYEPWNPAPDAPRLIQPKGTVDPDFVFRALIPDPAPEDPVTNVDIEVRRKSNEVELWTLNAMRAADWPDGESYVENPRQPDMLVDVEMEWRQRSLTGTGLAGPWTDWREFTVSRASPTVTPEPLGARSTMLGTRLRADWTV